MLHVYIPLITNIITKSITFFYHNMKSDERIVFLHHFLLIFQIFHEWDLWVFFILYYNNIYISIIIILKLYFQNL